MKRIGPELKMPDLKTLKVPDPLADVYYDLRERRLLPLVALVVVAIAAVPFLLGGDSETAPPSVAETPGAVAEDGIAQASRLTVVEAKPGLRDYKKRLRGRTPTDPFVQKYTSVPKTSQLKSTGAGEGSATPVSGGGGGAPTVSVSGPEVGGEPEGSSGSAGGSPEPAPNHDGRPAGNDSEPNLQGKRLFGYRPDIRFGLAGSGELRTYEELPLGSLLPKKKAVLLFVGVTQNGKRALFSVTPEIAFVRGDGDCIGGRRNCHILSLEVGQAADLVTSIPGRVFRLKVNDINFVELDLPVNTRRASGSSSDGGDGGRKPAWGTAVAQSFNK